MPVSRLVGRPWRYDRTVPYGSIHDPGRRQDREKPLDDGDAARHLAHLTGMTPEAAEAFAAYHSGRFAHFKDAA